MIRSAVRPSRPAALAALRTLGLLIASAAALLHCGAADDALPMPGGGVGSPPGAGGSDARDDGEGVRVGPCDEEGESRTCTAHHEAGCTTGVQSCDEGTWSPCRPDPGGEIVHRDLIADTASRCGTDGTIPNACDPACNAVTPSEPDFGGGGIVVGWESGSLGGLPAAALAAGLPTTCTSDADCQFDHYCEESAQGGTGECRSWSPGQGNTACGGDYDVTVGVPCDDEVPICNRGNVAVSAAALSAMQIRWKPAPPYRMDGCSLGTAEGSCPILVTEDLDVGRCVAVACDVPPNRVLMVDAGAGNADECECHNNWSYNTDAACEAPPCGAEVSSVTEVKLTLFLSLDISGSMLWDRGCPYDKACTGSCSASNCSGACISSTECSTHQSDSGKCCWNADTPAHSRWGAVHAALEDFVGDDESDGLGVVMKFWGTGTCQASSCNAVDDFPEIGTCAHSPCDTSGGVLASGCAPFVADVCTTAAREYCCGLPPQGTCAFSPCSANAGTLVSGCGGTSTPIKTSTTATCAAKGFEGCCNGTTASGGNWGMNKAPCTATTTMTCRNASGATIACNSATAATAPTTSLTYSAYQTAVATPSCITTWNAACVNAFRARFAVNNGGRDPCGASWDAGCATKYAALAGSTPGSSCTYQDWNAACATTAAAKGAVCTSTACNRPSIPSTCTSAGTCPLVLSAASPDPAETAIVAKLATIVPSGGTPSAIAVEGAADFCTDYQLAHPDERCAVVFVSDGQPNGCGAADDVYAAAGAAADSDVNVFAIGIAGAGTDFMNTVADRGNTTAPFFISPDTTAASDFLEALQDIRNQFSCRERLPPGADLDSVDVRFFDGVTSSVMTPVASIDDCAGLGPSELAYYPVSDDEIALCPRTCEAVEQRPSGAVEIVDDCGPPAEPVTVDDAFSAGAACDDLPGTTPKWTVMFYEADVPRGSSISVRARTRLTPDHPWRSYVDIVTITPANAISEAGSPTSLQVPLGAGAYGSDIEIELTTGVYGGAPVLSRYELQLTCAATE